MMNERDNFQFVKAIAYQPGAEGTVLRAWDHPNKKIDSGDPESLLASMKDACFWI